MYALEQTSTIEDFYGQIQHILSLLINNTNISIEDQKVKTDRIKTHQENALQVFLAGLREPIGGNVRANKPNTVKEAFDVAIDERNYRNRTGLTAFSNATASFPRTSLSLSPQPPLLPRRNIQNLQSKPSFYQYPVPRLPALNRNVFAPRTYPSPQPPPTPMEVDNSIRSRQMNYMNRPTSSYPQNNLKTQQPFPQNYSRNQQPFPQNNFRNHPSFQQRNFYTPPRSQYPVPQNFFSQTGPPKFQVEELRTTEHHGNEETDNQSAHPYNYYDESYPNEFYPQDANYDHYSQHLQPEENQEEIKIPRANNADNTQTLENLNFQVVGQEKHPT